MEKNVYSDVLGRNTKCLLSTFVHIWFISVISYQQLSLCLWAARPCFSTLFVSALLCHLPLVPSGRDSPAMPLSLYIVSSSWSLSILFCSFPIRMSVFCHITCYQVGMGSGEVVLLCCGVIPRLLSPLVVPSPGSGMLTLTPCPKAAQGCLYPMCLHRFLKPLVSE